MLKTDVKLAVNGVMLPVYKFPGGELHVTLTDDIVTPDTTIQVLAVSSDAILATLLVKDAIDRQIYSAKIDLVIGYFPYARQDRVCNPGEAFSLKVITDLINSANFNSVCILDPHSDVTPALINNCEVMPAWEAIKESKILWDKILQERLVLVSPDAGAEKKLLKLAEELSKESKDVEVTFARKVRNVIDGKILRTEVDATFDFKDKDLLIVDDICDGGRTFIELAKVLKTLGANKVYLYVSHGIFSAGFQELKTCIDHVYTCGVIGQHDDEDYVTHLAF